MKWKIDERGDKQHTPVLQEYLLKKIRRELRLISMDSPWVRDLRTGFGHFISVRLAKIATYNFWGAK